MNYTNLTMLTDLYELTMMQGYFLTNKHKEITVFDMFFRENPSNNSYSVFAGLEQVIDYISKINFSFEDIEYLRSLNTFKEEFLQYLSSFKFTGDIFSVKEGTVVFPNEPVLKVVAPILEAQLIESCILNIINHQSLIATKASRVVTAANGDIVLEFGLRRAQGPDAGIYGTRAAIIAGCHATSNVLAGKMFNIPVSGTHAHSWIMSFDDELTAFREYANIYTDKCYLLVDTYNTLESGVPNAIKVFNEQKEKGLLPKQYGIRLDSGDLAYLSIEARKMLDKAGFKDALISASNDLDEHLIKDLKLQGAKIDVWGVGTHLITSKDWPALGGVYKLAAKFDENGVCTPKIKLSSTIQKVTTPGVKEVWRLYDKKHNKIKADLITLDDETINENEDLTIFHPQERWKKKHLKKGKFVAKKLLVPILKQGEVVYDFPPVMEIRDYCKNEMNTLWNEFKRFNYPQIMPVDLSEKLCNLKIDLIKQLKENY